MEDFKEIFENYGGDYNSTMPRFMNNESMYRKFLNMLFKDDNLKKLNDAIQSGDLEKAFEAAHTLKGVCANLGFTQLFKVSSDLTEELRGGAPDEAKLPELLEKVSSEYKKTVDAINCVNE